MLPISHFLDFWGEKLYHNSMDIWVQLAQFSCFETERLRLRPFQFRDDCDWFHEVASHSENSSYIFPMMGEKTESNHFFVKTFLREPLGVWAMENAKTENLVGMIRLEKLDKTNLTAEVAYFTHRSVWGQGFATEALKAVAFVAFHHLGLRKLYLITHAENLASQCVAQKVGFCMTKQFKGSDRYSKKTRCYIQFELSRGDYGYE